MSKLLSKSEATQKNDAVSMDERGRLAVHELTHHLIAEHYGLVCEGIEVGYMEGQSSSACGLAHIGDNLRRKDESGEVITPEESRAYVHAVLNNGYGDEAVFGTVPELRGDEADVRRASRYMETQWGFDPDEVDAFISKSTDETRKILADPKVREALLRAGTRAAKEYWGSGELMNRKTINETLNLREGQ
jgi:hypothetical protein